MFTKTSLAFAATALLFPVYVIATSDPAPVRLIPNNPVLLKVDRKLTKEPVYQSGTPRYALLVFGPEATARVWLVQDGDSLYVDRAGDGDLTKPGNRISSDEVRVQTPEGEVAREYRAELSIPHRGGVKQSLVVQLLPDGRCPELQYVGSRPQYAGADPNGQLAFGAAPQLAPVLHFDGPLTLIPCFRNWPDATVPVTTLIRGHISFTVRMGTPGIGSGTFAYADPLAIPSPVNNRLGFESPGVEFEFPNKNLAGKPIKLLMQFSIFG